MAGPQPGHGLQNHPERHADHAAQLRRRGTAEGAYPLAGLVQATDGNFYGSTYEGGSSATCTNGCGTVFKITPSGKLTTLHSFDGTDGDEPTAGLVQDTNGNFYGTTYGGGANN